VTEPNRVAARYLENPTAWEQVKRRGKEEVHRWIDEHLNGTSVTIVLIGVETASRDYVKYEIL